MSHLSKAVCLTALLAVFVVAAASPAQAARIMGKPFFPDKKDHLEEGFDDEEPLTREEIAKLEAEGILPPASSSELVAQVNAGTKLRRGALNFAFGWTEVFIWASEGVISKKATEGVVVGLAQGATRGLARTFLGAWDIATFIIPPYDGPTMIPDTPFGDLQS